MPTRRTASLFLALMLILSGGFGLTGCSGWHLRGSQNTVRDASVFLTGVASPTYQLLSQRLRQTAESAADADYLVRLRGENWRQSALIQSANGVTEEYALTLALPYSIESVKSGVNKEYRATINRSYTTSNNVNSDNRARLEQEQNMRRDATEAILRQLQVFSRP